MSKCYILDEHNNPLNLTHNETLEQMTRTLKNGVIENGIIIYENKAYEYIELNIDGEILRMLKDVTFYYKQFIENQRMTEVINELKRENKSLKKDSLTKLYRADYAMKKVRKYIMWASKTNTTFSVVMGDIDKFKNINDTYGHEFGNRVLEKIGETVLNNVRMRKQEVLEERRSFQQNPYDEEDLVIRYGGEEILIIYKNISLEDTINRVEELRNRIGNINVDGVNVTMSFGIYNLNAKEEFPEINTTNIYKNTSKMVELADKALYYSKENGRNRTSYYNDKEHICEEVSIQRKK